MHLSNRDINIIKGYFSGQPVVKAYLFGSYSRGEASENSDIDLLVELDYSQQIGWGYFSMKDELENQLQKKVDIVSARGLSKYIAPIIDKEKQLIYER